MAAVNQNSGKKHCQVLLAVLILLVYCASNILDYDSGSFEVKSRSATPPPKKQQPYYPIEPVVEGWPPDVSQNLSNYLKPNINTTLIKPNLPLGEQISWRGENYSKTHILICVHSAVNSSERRDLIRRTWAKEQKTLPTKVIFLIGISKNGDNYNNNNVLKEEANQNQDLLQEDFIDTYNNLTLKSMFMLKYAQSLSTSIKYLMKVDDDSYINLRRLSEYVTIIDKRCSQKCIVGHVLGPNSPVIRPKFVQGEVREEFTGKWVVPYYIYNQETFPNAVSGSGYIISQDMISCMFKSGLGIPFLNLEDVFITGLSASKCHVHLKNSQWFNFTGKKLNLVKKTDILIHGVKSDDLLEKLYAKFHKIYTGS